MVALGPDAGDARDLVGGRVRRFSGSDCHGRHRLERHNEREADIQEDPQSSHEDRQEPQHPHEGRVELEVLGDPGSDAGHEKLKRNSRGNGI